jgi:single-strand DNA-binding protein
MSAISIIVGHLCSDPEMRQIGANTACSFRVAVNTSSKDKAGNYVSNFYDCTIFGKHSERFYSRAQKGSGVTVWGEVAAVEYTAKDGTLKTGLRMNVNNAEVQSKLKGKEATPPAAANFSADDLDF